MKQPLVSIILPVKSGEGMPEQTIRSVQAQTYSNCQLIIVFEDPTAETTTSPKVLFFYNGEGKNAARNFGSSKAQGEYLLHIDDDMKLSPDVVQQCVETASRGFQAVIVPERYQSNKGWYAQACVLEKKIASVDRNIIAPRFIEKSLYEQLGGVDERLDPIDEGDLKAKLEEIGIISGLANATITILHVPGAKIRSRVHRMYSRGKKSLLFAALHQDSKQFSARHRYKPYLEQAKVLFAYPAAAFLLLPLKALDLLAFRFGTLATPRGERKLVADVLNRKIFNDESVSYQKEFFEATAGARYVDREEKRIVSNYINSVNTSGNLNIIDLGTGGGRWTRLVLDQIPGANVLACDLSEKMLDNLRAFPEYGSRMDVALVDMQELPFDAGSFDGIISIRAIKYAPDEDKVFYGMKRVLKPGGFAIIELPYLNIIYVAIRKMPFLGKLYIYANRIRIMDKKSAVTKLQTHGFKVLSADLHFTIPATFYKKTDSKSTITLLNILNGILPKRIFARSLFLLLEVQD